MGNAGWGILSLVMLAITIIVATVTFIIIIIVALMGAPLAGIMNFDIPVEAIETAIIYGEGETISALAAGKIETEVWKKYNKNSFASFIQNFDSNTYIKNIKEQQKQKEGDNQLEIYNLIRNVYRLCLEDTYTLQTVFVKGNEKKVIEKRACFPVSDAHNYSNDFGNKRVNNGKETGHEGIDIFAKRNTPILAVEDGYIDQLGWNGLGGWTLELYSSNKNRRYYYAHMEGYSDKLNRYRYEKLKYPIEVKKGEVIGYVGSSGAFSSDSRPGADTGTKPHLHVQFYIKIENKDVLINPYYYLRYLETDFDR